MNVRSSRRILNRRAASGRAGLSRTAARFGFAAALVAAVVVPGIATAPSAPEPPTAAPSPAAPQVPVPLATPSAAALDCRPISGTFRQSDLCTAVNTSASIDGIQFWTVHNNQPKQRANCDKAVDWMNVEGNAGIVKFSWKSPPAKRKKVTDTTVNVTVRMNPKATITMTRPRWPHMTAYQTTALDELMRRLEAHEMGHVQVLAEVARVQTGTQLVDTSETEVNEWIKDWIKDSNSLMDSAEADYEDVTSHGVTQSNLGGLNTTVQICDPDAAIIGDVPDGAANAAYQTVLDSTKHPTPTATL